MNNNGLYWMKYTIEISQIASQANLRIGVVLVSEENKLLCYSFAGEQDDISWCSIILRKVRNLKICKAKSVYITINTISETNTFDLIALLNEVHISEIYIGLPDPKLTNYLNNDPYFIFSSIYRYSEDLQCEILKLNKRVFTDSVQCIKNSPYYSNNRISNLVIEKLKLKGFILLKDELNKHKSIIELVNLICSLYNIEYSIAFTMVRNVIAESFNGKYGDYNYSNDARSLNLGWKDDFRSFYSNASERPLSNNNIINVGVGSGYEAKTLFSDCLRVTFVDIAQSGLEKIKAQIPLSQIIVQSADALSSIPNNSYDLYISLRTYNSAFFDTKRAIAEAHRVLKLNGVIIISIANGFLYRERNYIIPGLIIPQTEFVDIYRGIDTIKQIAAEFVKAGFKNIQQFLTNTEIYLSAVAE